MPVHSGGVVPEPVKTYKNSYLNLPISHSYLTQVGYTCETPAISPEIPSRRLAAETPARPAFCALCACTRRTPQPKHTLMPWNGRRPGSPSPRSETAPHPYPANPQKPQTKNEKPPHSCGSSRKVLCSIHIYGQTARTHVYNRRSLDADHVDLHRRRLPQTRPQGTPCEGPPAQFHHPKANGPQTCYSITMTAN